MIERLLTILQTQGLLLEEPSHDVLGESEPVLWDEDIADVLWLADKIGDAYELTTDSGVVAVEVESSVEALPVQTIEAPDPPMPSVGAFMPGTSAQPENIPEQTSEQTSEQTPERSPEKGLPIQVKAAPALPNSRELGRSLRPLMRKVPSLSRVELDELATVNRIAERDIWLPIFRPAPERWFDLELVVEASPFSFVWQDTLAEFQQLLEGQGAFRNVRTWSVTDGEMGTPRLRAKTQMGSTPSGGQFARSPKELIDVSGRRLVLFVSDCRSSLWQQGKIHDWLALWSSHGPTAIVQLLPERLWSQSELDVGFAVQVGALLPGAVNPKLQVRELPPRTQIDDADSLALPVVTLTEKALKQWALVVSAAGQQRTPARLFDLAWVKDAERSRVVQSAESVSAARRIEQFAAVASPIAQRLAKMMAAVPVELSVVRLIQQELLPEATPVHIAEVYASGLLEEVASEYSDAVGSVNESVRYEFAQGVRSLLNQSISVDDTLDVIWELSKHIAKKLGLGSIDSFTALLSPKSDWSQDVKDAVLPFAQITTGVLHQLGGDYADLARLVERDASQRSDWIQSVEDVQQGSNFPPLETFEFVDAQLVENNAEPTFPPPLQTEEFTVITFEEDGLERFDFTVVTLQRRSRILRRDQWEVQRQQRSAYRLVEKLPDDGSLEMVAIPAGSFVMGSPESEPASLDDESPQHEVTIEPFFMGRYPVTQAQWQAVAGLPQIERSLNSNPSEFKGGFRPVEQVSWQEAAEFCARLSAYAGREYRLPTEAEWEYACRAGTTTPFHFGETITTEVANYDSSAYAIGPTGKSKGETTPVDYFEGANAFGLSDMHGNVWEWCQDHWHNSYEGAPTDGSAWLTDDDEASSVLRGGSWIAFPRNCRSARRIYYTRAFRYFNFGFRVSCSATRT